MSSEDHLVVSTISTVPAILAPLPAERDGHAFAVFPHGHKDMVQAVSYNTYGDRFATGSVDGQIKVYNKKEDGQWDLQDTWTAHHSEILELQWLSPSIHPNILASIGIDGRFRLWAEDVTIAPNSGRRFSSLRDSLGSSFELRSPPRTPFLSMSLRHNTENRHTYLALLNRDGILRVWVNEEPEDLRNWLDMDEIKVCEKPDRGVETAFKVRFDPNLDPSYSAVARGLPLDALGLVVASMTKAVMLRTREVAQTTTLGLAGDVMTKEFYVVAELPGHRSLIRDIAWAPNSIRGYDIIATACKDGYLRVFEVHTPDSPTSSKSAPKESESVDAPSPQKTGETAPSREKNHPSGIGAGLAKGTTSDRNSNGSDALPRSNNVTHVVKEVAKIGDHRSSVWKVAFDADGQLLGSTGDDGKLWLWRRKPDGSWANSAQLGVDTRGSMGGVGSTSTPNPAQSVAIGSLSSN